MVTLTVFGLLFTCAASIAGLLTMIGDGPRWVVVVPVLVAALPPLVAARTRYTWIARLTALLVGLALSAFVIVAGFSIGLFYGPAALTMLVAAFAPPPLPPNPPPGPPPNDGEFWTQRSTSPGDATRRV
jgi:hypothetical protein